MKFNPSKYKFMSLEEIEGEECNTPYKQMKVPVKLHGGNYTCYPIAYDGEDTFFVCASFLPNPVEPGYVSLQELNSLPIEVDQTWPENSCVGSIPGL